MTDRKSADLALAEPARAAGRAPTAPRPVPGPGRRARTRFLRHTGAVLGAGLLAVIAALVLLGPWLWPLDPQRLDLANKDLRPVWQEAGRSAWAHPLGTDQLGRDQLAQLIAGGRTSLAVGAAATLVALAIGTALGLVAGYWRRLDGPLMRLTDLFLALPLLPLLLVAVTLFRQPLRAALGPEGGMFVLIVGVIGVTAWMPMARLVRGAVLTLRESDFVQAAETLGSRPGAIVAGHLLPNVASPILVSASLGLASAIITESALSFLGLGFPSDHPSWGKLLADAVPRMVAYPERVILPGAAISLTVLAVNYLGDGLRDALDPRGAPL
ncbi:ABC transporter permease [Roseivivax sp. CAU 1761]